MGDGFVGVSMGGKATVALNASARFIYMGDLNDDPVYASVRCMCDTTEDKAQVSATKFFNPMLPLTRRVSDRSRGATLGTCSIRCSLSPALTTGRHGGYCYYGTRIFNEPGLARRDGSFKGYPFRIYVGDNFTDGSSDHFPVFAIPVKEVPAQ